MNWGKTAGGLLGLMAGNEALGGPEEAQAGMYPFWKRNLLTDYYSLGVDSMGHRIDDNSKRSLTAFFEPRVWEQFHEAYPEQLNKVYMSPHELVTRGKQWPLAKTLKNIEITFSDPYGAKKPTWSANPKNSPYGLFSAERGPFYVPVTPWEDGFYAHTLLKPTDRQLARMAEAEAREAEGGGPTLMSGRGFLAIPPISQLSPIVSDVASQPSDNASVAGRSSAVKRNSQPLRQLGLGTRAAMEGLGSSLSLGLADPGRVLADWVGLPAPALGTPEATVSGAVRGGADVMGWVVPGSGMARMASGPVTRGVGQALSSHPGTQVALGSGLGYAMEGLGGLLEMLGHAHEMQDEEEW